DRQSRAARARQARVDRRGSDRDRPRHRLQARPLRMRLQRVRLRTILLLINLVILVLPLGGIFWLRIYESALVRQTESELIAQGVFVASAYDAIFTRVTQNAAREPRTKPFDVASYG